MLSSEVLGSEVLVRRAGLASAELRGARQTRWARRYWSWARKLWMLAKGRGAELGGDKRAELGGAYQRCAGLEDAGQREALAREALGSEALVSEMLAR